MKAPNGTGGVRKLSGNRKKKYQAVVTAGEKIANGKIVQKQVSLGVYETRKEAREALAKYLVNPTNLDDRYMTFADIYSELTPTFKKSMQSGYRSAFAIFGPIHNMKMKDIKARHLQMVADTTLGMSKSTQNNLKGLAHLVFQEALKNDIVLKDYSQFMSFSESASKRNGKAYSQEEVSRLLEYGPDWQKILVYTGMRINELLQMKCDDVHLDGRIPFLSVTKSKTRAGIRSIPIHPEILPIVSDNYGRSDRLIASPGSYCTAREHFNEFNKRNGIGIEHTPHDLRRTFSSYAKRCGLDDFYRKTLLGHAQGNLTDDVYTDAFMDDLYSQICMVHFN